MNLKIRNGFQVGALFLILVTSYTNCSKGLLSNEDGDGAIEASAGLPGTGDGICEDSLMGLFGRGYYKFVRANCISCHATDSDKPQFASPDINWAYKVFNDKGYTKVSDNAINANHQAGYTGPQHIQAVNELRLEWQQGLKEYSQCKGVANIGETVDPVTLLSLETLSTQLPAMAVDEEKTITWDLNKEVRQKKSTGIIPVLPGAKLSIVVVRRETAGGEEFFEVRKPLLVGSTVDIRLKTMYVQVNGRPLKYPTTFKFIDRSIRKGSTDEKTGLVSTGYLIVLGKYNPLDSVSLAFEKLEAIEMPAAQAPPVANLLGPKVLVIDSNSGTVNIEVELSKQYSEVVAMSLQNDNQALCGAVGDAAIAIGPTCLPEVYTEMQRQGLTSVSDLTVRPARSIVGNSFNRWNWDYENKVNSFLIGGGITRKSFEILFSKNIRKEENRFLKLKLEIAGDGVVPGSQNSVFVLIRKTNNPTPSSTEVTYSQLMAPKGIINLNCTECHNSRDLKGNYDVSNYDLMIKRGVLIPGDTRSAMYQRMNVNDPANVGKDPMPNKDYLPIEQSSAVSDWILSGAKNN